MISAYVQNTLTDQIITNANHVAKAFKAAPNAQIAERVQDVMKEYKVSILVASAGNVMKDGHIMKTRNHANAIIQ